ncbi:Nucleoporin autopeptidase [Dorcoceras hygrometricum]|uniref:Nucleoporin autopeptidase n=1 Tax=Dorcoceras hygrometricum TaxID=472368 RepID=A0A2Z7BCV8_9LAMI|nr:Nucleoporin autopeptidase [Dorcoceras hygrometricum]
MAASLIANSLQVNFDSVLSFSDEGMVAMFRALESTGLRGFLGFPSVLYEDDLVSFFANSLGAPYLTLGEAKTFPPLKILTVKTVGTYVAKNKNITTEEETDELQMEKDVKKAVAKRRLAPAAEPVAKRKRTTVGRAAPTEKYLSIVPVVQDPAPISVVPAVTPRSQRRRAPKRKLVLQDESEEERVEAIVEKVVAGIASLEMEEI